MGSILRSLDETKLRSLKFKDFGEEPYVTRELPDRNKRPFGTGNIFQRTYDEGSLQITRRVDDVVRMTKLLADAPGIKFIAKQQLINSTVNANKKAGFGRGLEQTAKTLAVILAQTAVSGTSIHLRSVIDEFTYLRRQRPSNEIPENLPGRPITQGDRVPSEVWIQTNFLNEDISKYLDSGYKFYGNSFLKGSPNSPKGLTRSLEEPTYLGKNTLINSPTVNLDTPFERVNSVQYKQGNPKDDVSRLLTYGYKFERGSYLTAIVNSPDNLALLPENLKPYLGKLNVLNIPTVRYDVPSERVNSVQYKQGNPKDDVSRLLTYGYKFERGSYLTSTVNSPDRLAVAPEELKTYLGKNNIITDQTVRNDNPVERIQSVQYDNIFSISPESRAIAALDNTDMVRTNGYKFEKGSYVKAFVKSPKNLSYLPGEIKPYLGTQSNFIQNLSVKSSPTAQSDNERVQSVHLEEGRALNPSSILDNNYALSSQGTPYEGYRGSYNGNSIPKQKSQSKPGTELSSGNVETYLGNNNIIVESTVKNEVNTERVASVQLESGTGATWRGPYNYKDSTPAGPKTLTPSPSDTVPGTNKVYGSSSNDVQVRLKMSRYTHGRRGGIESVDLINYEEPVTQENPDLVDIIPFKIKLYRPKFPTMYLYFRAHLDSMSDTFGGSWNPVNYIGRADTFYNFGTFQRNISVGFKIAAYSEAELLPLYRKLNFLAGSTAPTYADSPDGIDFNESPFMKGNFIKFTVGDYFYDIPGYFSNIQISWVQDYPWEISEINSPYKQTKNVNTPIVPHVLDIQTTFLPIHDFAAETGKPFIGYSDILEQDGDGSYIRRKIQVNGNDTIVNTSTSSTRPNNNTNNTNNFLNVIPTITPPINSLNPIVPGGNLV